MGKFPTYESRGTPQVGSAPSINVSSFGAVGRAISQLGGSVSSLEQHNKARSDQSSMFKAQTALNNADATAYKNMQHNIQNSEDGSDIFDNTLTPFDNTAAEIQKALPAHLQDKFGYLASRSRESISNRAVSAQVNAQRGYYKSNIESTAFQSSEIVANNPATYAEEKQRLSEYINNSGLDNVTKNTLHKKYIADLEYAHVNGRLRAGEDVGKVVKDVNRRGSDFKVNTKGFKNLNIKKGNKANLASIAQTAEEKGYDPVLAVAISHFESAGTFSTTIGTPGSSAKGAFQFLKSNVKEFGYGDTAASQTEAFVRKNNKEVATVERLTGKKLEPWEKYLTHFQGPGGAAAFINANPGSTVASVLTKIGGTKYRDQVLKGNGWMRGKTVKQFLARTKNEMDVRYKQFEKVLYDNKENTVSNGYVSPQQGGPAIPTDGTTYQYLTDQQRTALTRNARSALAGRKVELKQQMKDNVTSLRETGEPVDIDEQNAAQILKPDERQNYVIAQSEAKAEYTALSGLDQMTPDESAKRLQMIKPKPGQKGYDFQTKLYDKTQKKIEHITKLRINDPAKAVEGFDNVKRAESKLDPNNTESVENLILQRFVAQSELEIPEASWTSVTREEALHIIGGLRNVSPDQMAAVAQEVAKKAKDQYGKYADRVLRDAIRFAIKNKDDAAVASQVFKDIIDTGAVSTKNMKDAAEVNREHSLNLSVNPNQPNLPKPNKAQIEALKSDPSKYKDFGIKFGFDVAAEILGKQ